MLPPEGQTTVQYGGWRSQSTHSKCLPPPFLSNTYIMFHNLHMLWMCIYLSPHHISAALIGQDFWSYVLPLPWILVTSWGGNHSIVQWSWDYQPIQHGFHKLCQNVSMVFHDADVHVCETLSRYCRSRWPSFWKLPRNLVISQRGQTKVQCSGESYQHNQNSCHIIDKHI